MCLAIPGKVASISIEDEFSRLGVVDFGGLRKEVNLSFAPEARVGDYVLVHVGFAISTIDEREAERVFETLRAMEELEDLEGLPDAPATESER